MQEEAASAGSSSRGCCRLSGRHRGELPETFRDTPAPALPSAPVSLPPEAEDRAGGRSEEADLEDWEGAGAEARSCRVRAGKGQDRANLEKNINWFQGTGSAHRHDEERLHLVAWSSLSLLSKASRIHKVGGK